MAKLKCGYCGFKGKQSEFETGETTTLSWPEADGSLGTAVVPELQCPRCKKKNHIEPVERIDRRWV